MGNAKFTVTCPEMAFSQSHEIPIDARGYVRSLAEELEKAMDRYKDKAALHKLRQQMLEIKQLSRHVGDEFSHPINPKTPNLEKLLTLINEVSID